VSYRLSGPFDRADPEDGTAAIHRDSPNFKSNEEAMQINSASLTD
jgi:hypothetical protein